MEIQIILATSVILQFVAAFLSLRMIPLTGKRRAWILISVAVAFMAIRRAVSFAGYSSGSTPAPADVWNELLGLMITVLMVLGIAWIKPAFAAIKDSAEALSETERKYRSIFEGAVEGIFQTTPEGRFITVNPAHARIYGYDSPEEMIAAIDDIRGQIYADPHVRSVFLNLLEKNGFTSEFEFQALRKDGKKIWISENARAVRDDEGKILYYEGFATDITKRKEAEEKLDSYWSHLEQLVRARTNELTAANSKLSEEVNFRKSMGEILRQSEERFRGLVESTSDLVWEVDASGCCTYISPQVSSLLGYGPEDVAGKQLFLSGEKEAEERASASFREILARSEPFRSFESVHHGGNGKLVVLETNGVPFFGPDETLAGYRGISRDITERKLIEQELLRVNEEATAANRAKSDFLANMSHELRTPLNAVIGFCELILDKKFGPLNPLQEEYLTDVLNSGKHLLSLINDILDLSKIEAGKMPLQPSEVHLRDLLLGSLVMVKEKAYRNGLKVNCRVEPISETIRCDERRLKQILYNLLSNAVKFTPSGGTVSLSARRFAVEELKDLGIEAGRNGNAGNVSAGGYVRITVADSGVGIKAEDLERIFDPFEQVQSGACSRRQQGTGLGLSLVRRLSEMHHGAVWAESAGEGAGSSFHVLLPMDVRQVEDCPSYSALVPADFDAHPGETLKAMAGLGTEIRMRVSKLIEESRRENRPFALCRIQVDPDRAMEKQSDIRKLIQEHKRAEDLVSFDTKGNLYFLMQGADRAGAAAACKRYSRLLSGILPYESLPCSISVYPEENQSNSGNLIRE